MLHIEKNGKNVPCLGEAAKPGKFCNFSPQLNLEIVFPALKLTRNCYLNMNISFSWKLPLWSKMGPPLSSTNILCLLTKYEINGTSKIPMSKLFSDLGKIWKYNLGLYSKNLVFYLFHELGKIQLKQHSKIPKSLC